MNWTEIAESALKDYHAERWEQARVKYETAALLLRKAGKDEAAEAVDSVVADCLWHEQYAHRVVVTSSAN